MTYWKISYFHKFNLKPFGFIQFVSDLPGLTRDTIKKNEIKSYNDPTFCDIRPDVS